MLSNKAPAHVSFLCVLFLLMDKVRYEGMMSIEAELEHHEEESPIFAQFPEISEYPRHLEFMRDTLRLMVYGMQDLPSISFFAATARKSFLDSGGRDESLWDCIWAMLYAILSGNPPSMAAEYGRQAIPWTTRPTFDELEALLKSQNRRYRGRQAADEAVTRESIDLALDALFARLDAKP